MKTLYISDNAERYDEEPLEFQFNEECLGDITRLVQYLHNKFLIRGYYRINYTVDDQDLLTSQNTEYSKEKPRLAVLSYINYDECRSYDYYIKITQTQFDLLSFLEDYFLMEEIDSITWARDFERI